MLKGIVLSVADEGEQSDGALFTQVRADTLLLAKICKS